MSESAVRASSTRALAPASAALAASRFVLTPSSSAWAMDTAGGELGAPLLIQIGLRHRRRRLRRRGLGLGEPLLVVGGANQGQHHPQPDRVALLEEARLVVDTRDLGHGLDVAPYLEGEVHARERDDLRGVTRPPRSPPSPRWRP